jgi:probable F420-dependent oxidoreductase
MEFGLAVSLTDRSIGITELAPAVEAIGFESLFLIGHSHVPVTRGDLLDDPFHAQHRRLLDPFTVLATAAAVTTRLRLGTGVCIISQHDPILLSKQIATLDHLSSGRFLFGIGAGWLEEEMQNLGVEPSQRWDVMSEHLGAMKQIWTHDEAEFHGRFVDFDPIWMWPKPTQSPHPPLLVGGSGPRSLRIAAQHGDGWMPAVEDLAKFAAQRSQLRQMCDDLNRPEPPVTACFNDIDAPLIAGCVDLGIARCVILVPIEDPAVLQRSLTSCSSLRARLA